MEEEKIKAVKDWSEPKSIRDIQEFLDFANIYRKFISNFNRIAVPLTSLLQTTGNDELGSQTSKNKGSHDVPNAGGDISAGADAISSTSDDISGVAGGIGGDIKNL